MSNPTTFTPVVWTEQGLSKLLSASQQGISMAITHVSAGDQSYTPSATQTALRNEQQRVLIGGAEILNNTQLRFSALFDGPSEYPVKEVGIWSDTTLVAVYSVPDEQLNFKAADAAWLEVFTLNVSALPSQNVICSVGINNANVFLTQELLTMTYAQTLQSKNLIQQAHQNMLLNLRLRKAGL
ncbi:phage tail protein [Pseudoalteromonas sp. MMG022]|uniref:phage tail-collar fiber domain-containing protein n=1 Tax=Pseudoalteromonas sp. MMG022 TaxID=2909978 RepID=UPI001F18D4F0|nr:phage tail protein [Pseudoalteromonas sp. MMG022]MCF6435225.1 phage tail protein [Pseudoalteromonas sp. MMG022]